MWKNMCRVCGRYAANKRALNIFKDENILWKLQMLTGLLLENAEFFPDLICICCQTELREALRFRNRVIESQNDLLQGLTKEQLKDVSQEYRDTVFEFAEHSQKSGGNISEEDSDSNITHQKDITIECRSNDGEDSVDDDKQSGLVEYDIIIDDGFEAEETCDLKTSNESVTKIECEVEDDYLDDKELDEECKILDRVLNDEIAEAQSTGKIKRGRKNLGNSVFLCGECGRHVTGRVNYELHCKRHRGEKQYECEICQDRFCTKSELKRHMRRHTGERPYACQYCDGRFTDYSTRLKHERSHTNERPYVCQSCGKSFNSTYILKNHILTHTGERAHRCEMCNKSFLRASHLSKHCKSSAHKRNAANHAIKN